MSIENKDLIEKWVVLAGLHGVSIAELWDSPDDQAEDVFNHLERLEEIELHRKENEAAFKVAQSAATMGLTTEMLWRYHEYQSDLAHQEEERKFQEEEDNNVRLKKLRETHKMTMTTGKSGGQTYWTFEADLGDGVRVYNCRHVRVSWFTQRIWREWKDSAGKKQRDKLEFTGHHLGSTFRMDDKWPSRWQGQYGRNFSQGQIPYAYTHSMIEKYAPKPVKKTKKKEKVA